jgi:hypothetical protein
MIDRYAQVKNCPVCLLSESRDGKTKTARTGSYDPRPSLNINANQERDV